MRVSSSTVTIFARGTAVGLGWLWLGVACSPDTGSNSTAVADHGSTVITYVVKPPAGKLPFPAHDPSFDQNQYDAMVRAVAFANTFGGYEGSGDGSLPFPGSAVADWVHAGRDFMMPDGSKVFAVQAGTIRASADGLNIEDADMADYGWSYGHLLPDATLQVGQSVQQGQLLGVVSPGSAHICLVRAVRRPGGDWAHGLLGLHLDSFFDLPDNLPPEANGPLHYFQDASNQEIPRGNLPVLSGKVDVVAGLRDVWGHPDPNVPERMAPATFELVVQDESGTVRWTHKADMRTMAIPFPFFSEPEEVKHAVHLFFKPGVLFSKEYWGLTGYMYYVITNLPDRATIAPITESDEDLHWDTAAMDHKGKPVFENGLYVVTVNVADASGNLLTMKDKVRIAN